MTHDEARRIIRAHYREHYQPIATPDDVRRLHHALIYLSDTLAEHMAWDSAIEMAEWIKATEARQ